MFKKYLILSSILLLVISILTFSPNTTLVNAEDKIVTNSQLVDSKPLVTAEEEKKSADSKANNFQEGNKSLIVSFKTPKTPSEIKNILPSEVKDKSNLGTLDIPSTDKNTTTLISVKNDKDIKDVISKLKSNPEVELVTQNYKYQSLYSPNTNPCFRYASKINTDACYNTNDHPQNQNDFQSNEPTNGYQWYLKDLNTASQKGIYAESAWGKLGTNLSINCASDHRCGGDPSVKIAVIDTGVHTTSPDFAGTSFVNPMRIYNVAGTGSESPNPCVQAGDTDLVFDPDRRLWVCQHVGSQDDISSPSEPGGHGTKVASIIAMNDNSVGGIGIAYNTSIMPISIPLDTVALIGAIGYAKENGAKVINLSLGSPYYDERLDDNINKAIASGITVVSSSGNCGASTTTGCFGSDFVPYGDPLSSVVNPIVYPAAFPSVISVGATNPDGSRASYSTYNQYVDLVAPVSEVAATALVGQDSSGAYVTGLRGTSFAAPQVSAAAGLLLSSEPSLTQLQVQSRIKASTDKISDINGNGLGKLNVCKALKGCGWVEYDITHYFTWYDTKSGNYTWNLISNPNNTNIKVRIRIGSLIDEVYLIPANGIITPYFLNIQTGPVLISTENDPNTNQPFKIIATQRTRFLSNGFYSFNEYAAILPTEITNDYYFTWNDTTNGNYASTLIYNPSLSLSANVTLKIGGVVKATKTLSPGEIWTPVVNNLIGGPVEVTADNNIIASQRVVFNKNGTYSFNEFPGISASNLSAKYYFTWNDTTNGNSAWTLIGNPNNTDIVVRLKIGNSFSQDYSITANSSITPFISNLQTGPISVEAVTPGKNIFATQRVLYLNTFNEFPGISSSSPSMKYYFTWNDTTNGNYACTLIYNPSVNLSTNVTLKIGGVVKATKTLSPGEIWTPVVNNLIGGPVEVTADNNIIATQRVVFGQSFNEFSGIK